MHASWFCVCLNEGMENGEGWSYSPVEGYEGGFREEEPVCGR